MKTKPLLVPLRPRAFAWWRTLPIFGPLLDEFLQWMADREYAAGGERLPRALPWTQVRAFIQSIDWSEPFGRRDFTLSPAPLQWPGPAPIWTPVERLFACSASAARHGCASR